MKKVSVSRTGSLATPIPQNATALFTSASSPFNLDNLLGVDKIQSFRLDTEDDDSLDAHNAKKPAKLKLRQPAADYGEGVEVGKVVKKRRKTAPKKDDAAIDGTKAKKPQKTRTNTVGEEPREDDVVKEKAPRRSRAKKVEREANEPQEKSARKCKAKKADVDSQRKLSNAQVTKASTSKSKKDVTTKSKKKDPTTGVDPIVDSSNYGLVEAVKRRTNWTPPPRTAETISLSTPTAVVLLDGGLISGGLKASDERSKGFQDLFGKFGFNKLDSNTTERVTSDGAGTRKRKLIELVKTNVSTSTTTAVPKTKAPKKKPRTVTEQATSAYIEEDEGSTKPAPLLQYFSFETTNRVTSDGFKIPPKPRSKSPVKGGKGTAQAPILLSPESALKQVGNQDFVFGTSSQLAREESPTFLRDIHAAMQASNEIDDDDPFASSPVRLGGQSKALLSMKRNLWSAAARDGSGELLNVEMVNLADSPAVAKHFHTVAVLKDPSSEARKEDNEPWHDIKELLETPTPTEASIAGNSPKPIGPVEAAIRLELLSSPSNSINSAKSPARSSTQLTVSSPKATKLPANKSTKSSKAKDLEKPDFAAYTMAQLTKKVASYHFKPIKTRDGMIALLEKCWVSKQRLALGTRDTNLPISSPKKDSKSLNEPPPPSQAQVASPKRPRGKPKNDSTSISPVKQRTKTASIAAALSRAKKAQKKAEALDEISDSDTAPTPSPPRRRPSQVGTPPLPLQLSSSTSVDSRELSPTSSQVRLFKYITAAVRGATPSSDSLNPSWHEKILLYDPIILEDLTVWLNTGALEKAGWDGEVDPKEVKKWCESESICCLWRENLRGRTRSGY